MRSKLGLLACTLLSLCLALHGQTTIHVPADQPTVQAGINAANPGDTVLVAPGTYNENIDFKGKAITVTSSGGPAVTTINGRNGATVVFVTFETRASVLSGFTISEEKSPQYTSPGGIYIGNGAPTIVGNIITDTRCTGVLSLSSSPLIQGNEISYTHYSFDEECGVGVGTGSGILLQGQLNNSVAIVRNNIIEFNTESGIIDGGGNGGAGIAIFGGFPIIEANVIRNNATGTAPNATGGDGGAILYDFGAGGLLVNNLIYGNSSDAAGGGIAILDSTQLVLLNNTIVDNNIVPLPNVVVPGGAQIFVNGTSVGGTPPQLTLLNNIISGSSDGPSIVCSIGTGFQLSYGNDDIYNARGTPTGSYQGNGCSISTSAGNGTISADPQFVSSAAQNYHLQLSSPAIDVGSNGAVQLASAQGVTLATDLNGDPRILDATHKGTAIIDMGAYEYQAEPPTTLSLVCNPNSIPIGGTSLLNAVITAAGTTPTGTLTLTDSGTALAQLPLLNGASTYTYIGQAAGTHTLTVSFASTPTLGASTASCTVSVVGLPSTSVLSVNPISATYGTPVTLTASVAPATPPGGGTPTGTVTFLNGSATLGTAALSGGMATLTASLPGGTDNLTCTYSGNATYNGSSCNLVPVTPAAAPSTLTLVSSPNPVLAGVPFTVTVHLTGNRAPAPAGTGIQLSVASGNPIPLTLDATGSATYTLSLPQPGTYPLTANFAGSPGLLASSASSSETVNAVLTSIKLTASPNPAYQGQTVTLLATVSANGSPLTSGSLTFEDGLSILGTGTLNASGEATLTTSSLAPGTHTLAAYDFTSGAFLGSISPNVQELILPSGFALNLTPATLTVQAGQKGTATITLSSLGSFAGPLALTVGALPTYAAATMTPTAVSLTAGGTGTASLLLTTSTVSANNALPTRPGAKPWPLVLSALLLLPLYSVRSKRLRSVLCLAFAAILLGSLTGCTTLRTPFDLTAAGTYRIPVTATDTTGHQQTATLTLVITP